MIVLAVAALVTAACGGAAHHPTSASTSPVSTAPASSVAGHTPGPPATVRPPTRSAAAGSGQTRTLTGAAHPCGVTASAHYTHVVWIWMENKPYSSVLGNANAPFENALAARCGVAADYHGVSHPSLPNYLAATGGSTFGVHDDAAPAAHPVSADSIFGQLAHAALDWRSYQESMPSNCYRTAASPYAVKHNPAAYFTPIRGACADSDVPLEGNLERDLAAGTLPSFAFVTPNLCHDTHDCSVRTGDDWLANWIPKLLDSPDYRSGSTLLVLTWDEGVGGGNHIPTIVVGPSVPAGLVVHARFDHYSLLRTTEDLLGLGHLGAAASAPSMAAEFRLAQSG